MLDAAARPDLTITPPVVGPTLQNRDKQAVRDLTEEAIAAGRSSAELKALRATLAESLGVSVASLRSVSAYVNYSATQAIRDADLNGAVSNELLVRAARLSRDAGEDRTALVALLAEEGGVEAAKLSAALDLYESYLQRRPGGCVTQLASEAEQAVTLPPRPVEVERQPSERPRDHVEVEEPAGEPVVSCEISLTRDQIDTPDADEDTGVRGDTANYDFPAKREWRAFWASFIRERFGSTRLRDAKVICLPGRAVEPEVSMYLAMGVKPENIYAVEGSARVRDEFVRNAQRLGVRYFTEPLLHVVRRERVKFDIVNYDFHGQFCMAHASALEFTPVAPDSILIYNALAKRESRDMQNRMHDTQAEKASLLASRMEWAARASNDPEHVRIKSQLLGISEQPEEDLSATDLGRLRRREIPNAVSLLAGAVHRPVNRALVGRLFALIGSPTPLTTTDGVSNPRLRGYISPAHDPLRLLSPLAMVKLDELLHKWFKAKVLDGLHPGDLGHVAWHSMFGRSYWVGNGSIYEYQSETKLGRPGSPFFTTAHRIRQSDAVCVGHEHAIDFAAAWIVERCRIEYLGREHPDYANGMLDVVDRRRRPKPHGAKLEWDDTLIVTRGGVEMAHLQVSELRIAMLAATAASRKDLLAL